MKRPLTPSQKRCFDYIKSYIARHGYAPRYEDMMDALGLPSKSNVHRLLAILEEKGHITRRPGEARAIELAGVSPKLIDVVEAIARRAWNGAMPTRDQIAVALEAA